MNENEITEIMKQNIHTSKLFKDCFARDELPKISQIEYPSCLILNTQKRRHAGEHWIAIYFDKHKQCTFFDSFASHPSRFRLTRYLKLSSNNNFRYNKLIIQGFSAYCGLYCIFFLIKFKK